MVDPLDPQIQCWSELGFPLAKLFPAGRRKSNTQKSSFNIELGGQGGFLEIFKTSRFYLLAKYVPTTVPLVSDLEIILQVNKFRES